MSTYIREIGIMESLFGSVDSEFEASIKPTPRGQSKAWCRRGYRKEASGFKSLDPTSEKEDNG